MREQRLILGNDLSQIQRTLGNQTVQRLLGHVPAGPGRQPGGALIQRDVTGDIALDSADFWTHLRSRAFTRLVAWIGDSRQKLNEFVSIMGDTDSPSPWGSVALSWIQVLGTAGDIVNAAIVSLQALGANLETPSTLFEFRNGFEHNLDAMSVRVNNLASDLPLYEALRRAEAKGNQGTAEEQRVHKQHARMELERSLQALPSPDVLKQLLVQRWMSGAGRARDDAGITYDTRYRVLPFNSRFTGEKDDVETRIPLVHRPDTDYYVAEQPATSKPHLNNVQRLDQTIKALRNAHGSAAPVHTLPIPMTIRFWISSPGKSGSMGGTPSFEWKRDPFAKTWAPVNGLGDEMEYAVFSDWLDRGQKPTLAELEKGFVR